MTATVMVQRNRATDDGLLHVRGLHTAQREIFASPARFRVVSAGRRFGKTRLGVILGYCAAATGHRMWWVAPTFPVSSIAWRSLRQTARVFPGSEVHESDRRIELPGGGWIQVKSADNPDSLRGEGLDLAIMDEAAFVAEAAWQESIRPALSDYAGRALFISTPAGRNWFWRLYQGAGEPGQTDWARWQFPTSANPYIAAAEIEAARASLPERIFQQEYLAQFLEGGAGVFRRVQEAATATPQDKPVSGHTYAFGLDWGKLNDFTAVTVIDLDTRELVCMDRFSRIDYVTQRARVQALAETFKPYVVVAEQNSMGEPLIEELCRMDLPVQPFVTTNLSKSRAIDSLALAFEKGNLKILNDPVLIGELQAFEATRLPGGLMRYAAPEGMHDDCVMSLALAFQGLAAE